MDRKSSITDHCPHDRCRRAGRCRFKAKCQGQLALREGLRERLLRAAIALAGRGRK